MKKCLLLVAFTIFALTLGNHLALAQAPQAIPYQAVARDNTGATLSNQLVSLRLSIRNLSATGSIVYQETHAVTTNSLGLLNLNIGQGTPVTGTLSAIDWANGNKYVQVEMDATGGTNYSDMGTNQLMSVPYALTSGSDQWKAVGNTISNKNTGKVLIGTQTSVSDEKLLIRSITDQAGWMNTDGNIKLCSWLGSYGGGTGGWLGTYSNHPLHFFTNFGVSQMTIQQNGNVGIGTTNPQAKLDLVGNIKIADGTQGAGKVLTSDANGVASWNNVTETDPQVGSVLNNRVAKWNGSTLTDGIITDDGSRVGIGNNTPQAKLHVLGDIQSAGNQTSHTQGAHLEWNKDGSSGKTYLLNQKGLGIGGMVFGEVDSTNIITQRLNIDYLGRVGVGVSNPGSFLHVNDPNMFTSVARFQGAGGWNQILVQSGTSFVDLGVNDQGGIGYVGTKTPQDFALRANNSIKLLIEDTTGNIGIGTLTPQAKLDIAGNIKIADGTEGTGKVLTSDANGVATWNTVTETDPQVSSVLTNQVAKWNGSTLTDGIITDYGSRVGIGNSTPQAKLHVLGDIQSEGSQTTHTQGAHLEWNKDGTSGKTYLLNQKGIGLGGMVFGEADTANNITERLSITNTGRVGIGRPNPASKLHVYDSVSFATIATFQTAGNGFGEINVKSGNATVDLGTNDLYNYGYTGTKTQQDFVIRTNDAIKIMVKDATGNVGIGTFTPQARLDIAGNIKITDGTQGAGKVLTSNADGVATWNTITETDPQVSSVLNNRVAKWNGSSLTDGIITDDGSRIGIGNNNPLSKLHVMDSQPFSDIARFQGPSGWNQIVVQSGNSSVNLGVNDPGGVGYVGTNTPQDFAIRAGSDVKMLIEDTTGNVGIGMLNPQAKLDINGNIKFKGFHARNGVNGTSTNNIHNFFWTGFALQAWVDGVNVGTVAMTSDRRLKDQILPMKENAVSRVMQLKPVSFHYKTIEGSIFNENPQIQEGFIADELQAVIPSAVIGQKDAVNAEGQIQPQTLNTTPIISLLTKAIQEQQQQIEMLLKRIDDLEKK